MKKLTYQAGIIISSLFVLAGCSKDTAFTSSVVPPPCSTCIDTFSRESQDTGIYSLKIYNWTTVPNSGIYTYDLGTVNAPADVSSSFQVNVYLLTGTKKQLINNPVTITEGSIWTIINGLSVKIVYRNESGNMHIPFTDLTIKIEIK